MIEPVNTTAALIGGGAALGGSLLSGIASAFSAERQMDFQREMASTAHQRQVADLKKAGLNPILSAKYGGAQSPSGAMANIPDLGHSAKTAVDALNVASQLRVQSATAKNIEQEAKLKEQETALKKLENWELGETQEWRLRLHEARLLDMRQNTRLTGAQEERVNNEIRNIRKQYEILENQRKSSAYGLSQDKAESKFYESIGGDLAPWIRMLGINPNIIPGIGRMLRGNRGRMKRRETYTNHRGDEYTKEILEERR